MSDFAEQILDELIRSGCFSGLVSTTLATNAIKRALADRPAPAVQVPSGWKLVPMEPTLEMLQAAEAELERHFDEYGERADHDWIYRAMLAAAPAPAPVAAEAEHRPTAVSNPASVAFVDANGDIIAKRQLTPWSELFLGPGKTEAVAQGGGVDAEKVMALVEEYGEQCEAAGYLERSGSQDTSKKLHESAYQTAVKIRALLASPAGMGWVAVSDRLPEPGTVCLVALQGEAAKYLPVQIAEWVVYTERPVEWSSATVETGEGWAEHDFDDVTHWQPLPAPPAIAKQQEAGK